MKFLNNIRHVLHGAIGRTEKKELVIKKKKVVGKGSSKEED